MAEMTIHEQIKLKTLQTKIRKAEEAWERREKRRREKSFLGRTEKRVKKLKKDFQEKAEKVRKPAKKIRKRVASFGKEKVISRKILRKGKRPVLDLRRRPDREVPVKQHGFKEGEIRNSNFLFN